MRLSFEDLSLLTFIHDMCPTWKVNVLTICPLYTNHSATIQHIPATTLGQVKHGNANVKN